MKNRELGDLTRMSAAELLRLARLGIWAEDYGIPLLGRSEPFARHVAVCENHDGSKFQELAERFLDETENACKRIGLRQ